jgi:hypothetical protein
LVLFIAWGWSVKVATGRKAVRQARRVPWPPPFPSAQLVWQIGDAGRTTEQMAELLELPLKEARRLLGVGLTTANWDAAIAIDHDLCSDGVECAKDFASTNCWMDQRLPAQVPRVSSHITVGGCAVVMEPLSADQVLHPAF